MRAAHYAKYLSGVGGGGRSSVGSAGRRSRTSFTSETAADVQGERDSVSSLAGNLRSSGSSNSGGGSHSVYANARTSLSSCGGAHGPIGEQGDTVVAQQAAAATTEELEAVARKQAMVEAAARRRQMERQISAARRAANHAKEAKAAAQAEAQAGLASVARAQAVLAGAQEETARSKCAREDAEEEAAAAERRVAELIEQAHRLRTELLEKAHQQFLTRPRQRSGDYASSSSTSPSSSSPVRGGSSSAMAAATGSGDGGDGGGGGMRATQLQPFDGCLLAVPAVPEDAENELESSIEPPAEMAATPGSAVCSGGEGDREEERQQNEEGESVQTDSAVARRRIGSICEDDLPSVTQSMLSAGATRGCPDLGESSGVTKQAERVARGEAEETAGGVALEEAKVAQLQRGLRLALVEDKLRLEDSSNSPARRTTGTDRGGTATSRSRGSRSRSRGSRSPRQASTGRRHTTSLHCRSPRDRHRGVGCRSGRSRRAVYGGEGHSSSSSALGVSRAARVAGKVGAGKARSGSF
jgi:hypothetical protein